MAPSPNKLSQFWQELKRRNVTHVLAVYIASAFMILELVDMISEPFGLPEWSMKVVFFILLAGLAITVVVSWIYDIRSEGGLVKTQTAGKVKDEAIVNSTNVWKIASYISFMVIVGLIALNLISGKPGSKIDESLAKSIAVLPFHNYSGDASQDYRCEGLTDEIISHLFKVKSFEQVRPLTSVLPFKDSEKSIIEIAEALDVNYILEGSYHKMGDELKISARLIEASNNKLIWLKDYDLPFTEVMGIPGKIALQIADNLNALINVSVIEDIQKIPTTNSEAYETLHKAYYSINAQGFGFNATQQALEMVSEAIRIDPEYADAYAMAGQLTLWQGAFAGQTEIQHSSLDAIQYFEKALELDQNNAVSHVGKGNIHEWARWDYIEAQYEYQKALELEPNNPNAIGWASDFYLKMVQLEKLWEIIGKTPMMKTISSYWKGQIISGNFQEAYASLKFASEDVLAYRWIGESFLWLKEYDSAKFYLEFAMKNEHPDMSSPRFQAYLSLAYGKTNHHQQARAIIDQMIAKSDTTSVGSPEYFTGWYYSGMGVKDSAFYWLEKAYVNHSPEFPWLKVDPTFNTLKDDPRYRDLYERTGHKVYDDYMGSKN